MVKSSCKERWEVSFLSICILLNFGEGLITKRRREDTEKQLAISAIRAISTSVGCGEA